MRRADLVEGVCWDGLVLFVAEGEVLEGDGVSAAWCGSFHGFAGPKSEEKAHNSDVGEDTVGSVVGERSG